MLDGGLERQTGAIAGKLAGFGAIPEDDDEVGDGRTSVLGGDTRAAQGSLANAREQRNNAEKEDEDSDILSGSDSGGGEKPMGLADARAIEFSASYKSRGRGGDTDAATKAAEHEKDRKELSESGKGSKKELSESGKGSKKELSESGKAEKKELSESGKGSKKELSESGKGSKKELSESGKGSKKELSESGKGSKKELSESGKGSKKELSESGKADKKELSESGKGSKKELSESGKGSKKELSESGKGEKKDLSESGKGERKQLSDAGKKELSESGKGSKKELSESGKAEKKELSESGKGSKKDLSESGKGEKKDLSESGKGERKQLSDAGKKDLSEPGKDDKKETGDSGKERKEAQGSDKGEVKQREVPDAAPAQTNTTDTLERKPSSEQGDGSKPAAQPPADDAGNDKQDEKKRRSSSSSSSSQKKEDDDKPTPTNETPEQREEEPEREEGLIVNDQVPTIPKIQVDSPMYSMELLDSVLNRFIRTKGKSFPRIPMEMRKSLFQHIRRRRAEAIEYQNYEDGEKLMYAQDTLRKAITKAMIASESEYAQVAVETRLKEVKEMYQEKKDECDENMKRLNKDMDSKERDIKRQHRKELDEFSTFWMDPSSFHEFNKPSGLLLEMRNKEKNMALLGDFTGAKDMKKRADAQEKLETTRAQARAKLGMQTAYEQLMRKHQRELEAQQRLRQKVIGHAQVYADAELNPMLMAIKKLELMKEQKPVKRWTPRVSRSQLVRRRSPGPCEDDSPPVSTPRTMRRLVNIRATPRNEVLSLQGVPAKRYIKIQQKRERKKIREQERAQEERRVKPTNF